MSSFVYGSKPTPNGSFIVEFPIDDTYWESNYANAGLKEREMFTHFEDQCLSLLTAV